MVQQCRGPRTPQARALVQNNGGEGGERGVGGQDGLDLLVHELLRCIQEKSRWGSGCFDGKQLAADLVRAKVRDNSRA